MESVLDMDNETLILHYNLLLTDYQLYADLVGIIFYAVIILIVHLSDQKVFDTPFFLMFKIGGIFDIKVALATVFLRVSKTVGLCYNWDIVVRICALFTGSNYMIHIYLNMLMTFNRLTATAAPVSHKVIWKKQYYLPVVAVIIVVSFLLNIGSVTVPFGYMVVGGFCERLNRGVGLNVYRIFATVSLIIFEIDCFILTPITIYKFYKARLEFSLNPSMRTEASLAFFVLVKFLFFSMEALYETVQYFQLSNTNFFFKFVADYVVFKVYTVQLFQFLSWFYILMVMNGPLLVVLSGPLRRLIRQKLSLSKVEISPIDSVQP